MTWILFLSLILVLINAAVLLILGPLLRYLLGFHSTESLSPVALFPFLSGLFPQQLSSSTLSYGALAWIAAVSLALMGLGRSWTHHRLLNLQYLFALRITHGFRLSCFEAVLARDYHSIYSGGVSLWMSIVVNDVHRMGEHLSYLMRMVIKDSALLVGVFLSMMMVDPLSGLLMVIIALPIFFYGYGAGRYIERYVKKQRFLVGQMSTVLRYVRQNLTFIKISRGEAALQRTWQALVRGYFDSFLRVVPLKSVLRPSLELLSIFFLAAVLFLHQHADGSWLSQQALFQLFLSIGVMMRPLKSLGDQMAGWGELRGFLARGLEIFEDPSPLQNPALSSAKDQLTVKQSHELQQQKSWPLKDLRVGFPGSSSALLHVTAQLSLKKGRLVAVVGASGVGKSLFLKTLAGLYAPLGVTSCGDFAAQSAQSSYVPQFALLFGGSVWDNLRYPEEDLDEAEVIRHLQAVGLIAAAREGKDFLRRQMFAGSAPAFSQGQLQRLTVVREVLRRKPWQLFDEASSALSMGDELKVMAYIKEQSVERSCGAIWVSHRPQSLIHCDEVWVMHAGGGVENYGRVASEQRACELMSEMVQ